MQKITPCLWFDDKAEEAAKYYVSIFKHSKLGAYDSLWRGRRRGLRQAEGLSHDCDV